MLLLISEGVEPQLVCFFFFFLASPLEGAI
jgi:hypothetical protein